MQENEKYSTRTNAMRTLRRAMLAILVALALPCLTACVVYTTDGLLMPTASASSATVAPTATPSPTVSLAVTTTASATATPSPAVTETETPTPPPAATATATAKATPTPTTGVSEESDAYVTKVVKKNGVYQVSLDYVQFLGGQEAIDQAIADGNEDILSEDEDGNYTLDDDYYISNQSKKIRTFPVATTCKYKVCDWNSDDVATPKSVTRAQFMQAFQDRSSMLVHVRVKNGKLTLVEEIYTP